MEWKKLFSLKAVKEFFDWTPVSVSLPKPKIIEYKDTGKILVGYEVAVQYLHHGKQVFVFAFDEMKLGLFPRRYALKRAVKFYKDKKKEIISKQQNQSNYKSL